MWLPFCSEADPLGNGTRSIDREVVYSGMTDWRRFGRAPDFSQGRLRTWSLDDGIAENVFRVHV